MCNLLYGFAKAGFADLAALAAFDAECARPARRAQLTSQAVANMLWSFATLKYCPEKSLAALAGEVAERAAWFNEQELANALWALARLGYEPPPQSSSSSSGGGGTDGVGGEEEEVDDDDDDENDDGEEDVYRRRRRRPRLLEAASARVVELARGFNVQACGNTLWALAVFGGTRMPCFNVLAARMAAEVEPFVAAAAAEDVGGGGGGGGRREVVDAGGAAQVIQGTQVNQLFQALLLTQLERDAATRAAAEAAKASVIAERSGSGASRDEVEAAAAAAADAAVEAAAADAALPSIPDAVARHVTRLWLQNTQNTIVSVFQEDVAATLRDLGVRHAVEYTTADGLFSVDIAIEQQAAAADSGSSGEAETATAAAAGTLKRVAIECDGPFHFAINTHAPTGATKLRRRLLRMLGWAVLPLPFYDHYALGAGAERARYLAALLRTAGVAVDPARAPEPADAAAVEEVERAFLEKKKQLASSSNSSAAAEVGGEGGPRVLTPELIEAAARAAARGAASPIAAPPGSLVVPRQYSEEQAAASAAAAAAAPAPGATWASAGGGGVGGGGGGGRGGALSVSTSSSSPSLSEQQRRGLRGELAPVETREVELTEGLIDAARRAALAAQGGRGPVPREQLAGLGLVLKRDAAMAPSRFVASAGRGGSSSSSQSGSFSSVSASLSRRLGFQGQLLRQQQQSYFERSGGGDGGAGYRGNGGGSFNPGRGRGGNYSNRDGGGGGGGYSGYGNRDGGYDSSWSQSGGGGGSSWTQSGGGGGSSWTQRGSGGGVGSSSRTTQRNSSGGRGQQSGDRRDAKAFSPLEDWDSFEGEERRSSSSRSPAPRASSSSFDRGARRLELSKLTVPALGLLATAGGVKKSGLRKAELVEALLDAEERQQKRG